MATQFQSYVFEPGGPVRLKVSWTGYWQDLEVRFDGERVGGSMNDKDLLEGRQLLLPDGSTLDLGFAYSPERYLLDVKRNGVELLTPTQARLITPRAPRHEPLADDEVRITISPRAPDKAELVSRKRRDASLVAGYSDAGRHDRPDPQMVVRSSRSGTEHTEDVCRSEGERVKSPAHRCIDNNHEWQYRLWLAVARSACAFCG